LTKPVRRADLLEAVALAIVGPQPLELTTTNPARAMPSINAHVLVAEDNPINEEVLRELLTSLGCTYRTASNGRAACVAFESETFDIVLMDCQMPEMDGLTATSRIRQFENMHARPRTPIIAVTANAFDADRIASRTAGMDDYLLKPFTEEELSKALTRWIKPVAEATRLPASSSTAEDKLSAEAPVARVTDPTLAGLDQAFLDDLRLRRPQLFERLLTVYMTHAPTNVGQLLDALAQGQSDALYLAAHSLKSSSANVGAKRIAELARQIEAMARSGPLAGIAPIAEELRVAFEHTQTAMKNALEQARTGT
jgi:CheY-like chemotaxis protein